MICVGNIIDCKKFNCAKLWHKKGDQCATLTVLASNKQEETVGMGYLSLNKPTIMGMLYTENHTSMPIVV